MYADETQLLTIDETRYEDDADMMYILHRLTAAAADPMMRQDMNVEDEYFSTIEDLDTQVMKQKKQLSEQKDKLAEQDKQLAERNKQLAEQDKQLAEQDKQLAESQKQLEAKDIQIKNMVKAMSANGMSHEMISDATGLTVAAIETILS